MKIKKLKSKHKIVQAIISNELTTFYVSHEEIYPGGESDEGNHHLIICGLPDQIVKPKELRDNKTPKVYLPIDNVIFVK